MLLTYRARVERADSSETLIALTVPEKPGFFKKFYDCVYPRNVRAHLGRTEPAVNKTALGALPYLCRLVGLLTVRLWRPRADERPKPSQLRGAD